jgi:hypothetical protein
VSVSIRLAKPLVSFIPLNLYFVFERIVAPDIRFQKKERKKLG